MYSGENIVEHWQSILCKSTLLNSTQVMFILWLSQLQYYTTGKPQFPWLCLYFPDFTDQFQFPWLFQVFQATLSMVCHLCCVPITSTTRLNPFAGSRFYNATAVRGALWWLRKSHRKLRKSSTFARRRHDFCQAAARRFKLHFPRYRLVKVSWQESLANANVKRATAVHVWRPLSK